MRSSNRIEEIRSKAAELFANHGYGAVGVAELGEAVGLGKGALYHHISSKEELLYDISTRYIEGLIENGRDIIAKELDPSERIKALSRAMINVVYRHRAEMTVCFREIHSLSGERHQRVSQLHNDYQQLWIDTIAMGVAQKKFRSIERTAIKGIMGMFFYSFLWLKPEGAQNADQVGDVFSDFILHSLIPWSD